MTNIVSDLERTQTHTPANETPETLTQLMLQLAGRDWTRVTQAEKRLLAAGQAGMQAVLEGMNHAHPRVRRACAGWMDHHGDDLCIAPLIERLLNDPVPRVRREAVHSLCCDRCKDAPLSHDPIPTLLDVIARDPAKWVRYEAIYGLNTKDPDARVIAPVREWLQSATDRDLRRALHDTLGHHDPAYRAECNAQARQRNETARPQTAG